MKSNFEKELEVLINRYSKENDSSTPDFILAKYLVNCLENFNTAVLERERWYGRESIEDTQLKIPEFDNQKNVFIGHKTTYSKNITKPNQNYCPELREEITELEAKSNMLCFSIEKLRKKYGLGEFKYSK